MTRQQAAAEEKFRSWALDGRDSGFLQLLADCIREDCRANANMMPPHEHLSHNELGRIRGIEEVLFMMVDPLNSRRADKPAMPVPGYGRPTTP